MPPVAWVAIGWCLGIITAIGILEWLRRHALTKQEPGPVIPMPTIRIPMPEGAADPMPERENPKLKSDAFCTRDYAHEGPCNGFPRPICAQRAGLQPQPDCCMFSPNHNGVCSDGVFRARAGTQPPPMTPQQEKEQYGKN